MSEAISILRFLSLFPASISLSLSLHYLLQLGSRIHGSFRASFSPLVSLMRKECSIMQKYVRKFYRRHSAKGILKLISFEGRKLMRISFLSAWLTTIFYFYIFVFITHITVLRRSFHIFVNELINESPI